MDMRIKWALAAFFLLLLAAAGPFTLPPANQSMHDVQQNEQRNITPGGAGIPGGTNPYFATTFPMPSPTVRR